MKLGVEAALVDDLLVKGDVEVDDGRIVGIGLASPAGRGIAVPGFVDLQVNGFGGVDFLDADAAGCLLAGGPVRLMTLAPELPGADALIDRLLERGVAVSLGHTDADAAQANAAFDRGARSVTHLFNAMRPFLHRDPGIAGAALARDDVFVSVILDGVHLAPETALTAWR